ncbi:MAG: bifunctional phosphopantothenoylcysteine decarboxylase/phosphopantothenate--cysteine ligase CoaBC [Acidimicrobiales bacterium]
MTESQIEAGAVSVHDALAGRRVVLGICGGIAAYKAVELCRLLVTAKAHVVPVMTRDASRFVGEVTFSALASEPVRKSLWDEDDPIPHTRLGQSADIVVVAPATARLIGTYAAGISSDLLSATLLATRAPVVVCPAMHTEMWEHAATQANVATLVERGVVFVGPGRGSLAGGDSGVGRMAEPADIVSGVCSVLDRSRDLAGVKVLVSAGGTREPIDPVRFIGNRSSGKQGHAVAVAAARRGAAVILITTVPTGWGAGEDGAGDAFSSSGGTGSGTIRRIPVETAAEMQAAVADHFESCDVAIMAAAVADFRPKTAASHKLDKSAGPPEIVLEATPDILAGLGRTRRDGQVLVGFAAETHDLANRAARKLKEKGIDLIVANDVMAPGVGFEHDTNAVTIIGDDGQTLEIPMTDKLTVADAVLDVASARLARRTQ